MTALRHDLVALDSPFLIQTSVSEVPQEEPCYEPDLEKQVSGQYHGLPTVSIPVETDWLWVSVVKDQTASPSILESGLGDRSQCTFELSGSHTLTLPLTSGGHRPSPTALTRLFAIEVWATEMVGKASAVRMARIAARVLVSYQ